MIPISVIIPAFNAERTLAEALTSVLMQERPAKEIIVVDDGSTDTTSAIAANTPGVRSVRQANAGTAAALNTGIALATGSILGFLDADDLWSRDTVASHLDNLDKHPSADASVGWFSEFICPSVSEPDARRFRPREPQIGWLSGSTFVRSESFSRVGKFDNEAREWPWIDWAHRAKLLGLVFVPLETVVLQRRLHPSSLSMRPGNKAGVNLIGAVRQAMRRHRSEQPRD